MPANATSATPYVATSTPYVAAKPTAPIRIPPTAGPAIIPNDPYVACSANAAGRSASSSSNGRSDRNTGNVTAMTRARGRAEHVQQPQLRVIERRVDREPDRTGQRPRSSRRGAAVACRRCRRTRRRRSSTRATDRAAATPSSPTASDDLRLVVHLERQRRRGHRGAEERHRLTDPQPAKVARHPQRRRVDQQAHSARSYGRPAEPGSRLRDALRSRGEAPARCRRLEQRRFVGDVVREPSERPRWAGRRRRRRRTRASSASRTSVRRPRSNARRTFSSLDRLRDPLDDHALVAVFEVDRDARVARDVRGVARAGRELHGVVEPHAPYRADVGPAAARSS